MTEISRRAPPTSAVALVPEIDITLTGTPRHIAQSSGIECTANSACPTVYQNRRRATPASWCIIQRPTHRINGAYAVKVDIEQEIQRSAEDAARNIRLLLAEKKVFAVNLISSPGSGKTTLIERTIEAFRGKLRVSVIEGDIETDIDAARIRKHGVQVHQINTRSSCHIPPFLLLSALERIDLDATDLLFVENVGNLVCPAEVPLGEDLRVVALSTAEGDEKPLKYPLVFKTSGMLVITKTDLLPYVRFDMDRVKAAARAANPRVEIFETSSVTGTGLSSFVGRVGELCREKTG
ncbi:MAG: hydrogenase nickel incorporation protein HypB [Deltaproteobacteria bacterium]|nr:hydrogenase nickel incorporation protein HypB [Deltaproteobacteria bacterium]